MSDDRGDEQQLSKRERQKLRRQRKQEAAQAAQRRARRRRVVITALLVLLLVGATGAFAAQWALDRAEERRLIEDAQANLDALGCTEVTEQPILPSQHFDGSELAQNPPEVAYPDRPTTSGRHIGGVIQTGVYDKVVDERLLVHNLEHGYVLLYSRTDAPDEQVAELRELAREHIDSGRHEKVIASEWSDDLPGDANFALVAWGARQLCREFDRGVALAFLDDWHWLAGDAPEKNVPVHDGTGGGGTDPDEVEGDLLLPPLDAEPVDIETEDDGHTHDDETDDDDEHDDAGGSEGTDS